MPPSDCASWYNRVLKLLGPPIEIDFEKEAEKRAARKGSFEARVIPSDEQCRYLERRRTNNNAEGADSDIDESQQRNNPHQVSSATTFEDDTSVQPSVKSLQSVEKEDSQHKEAVSFATALQPSRATLLDASNVRASSRQKRSKVDDTGGWISRSRFYQDEQQQVPDVKKEQYNADSCPSKRHCGDVALDDASTFEQTSFGETKSRVKDNDIECREDRDFGETENEAEGREDDDDIGASCGGDEPSSRQSRSRLFRPTAKRANQSLRQASLHQMFAK